MDGHLARPIGTETPRSKFASGSPFEKKRRESDLNIIKRVQELAQKHSWTMSQVALTWSLTKVSSPIVGANTVSSSHSYEYLQAHSHDFSPKDSEKPSLLGRL